MTNPSFNEIHTAESVLTNCIESISDVHTGMITPENQNFIKTGFHDIDMEIQGFQLGSLTILAGDSGVGKTNLMLSLTHNIALKNHTPVGIISMKHTANDLMMRIISSVCNINIHNLYSGKMNSDDWAAITFKVNYIKNAPLFIQDHTYSSIDDLLHRTAHLVQEKNCKIIFIDDFPFRYCHPDQPVKETERFVFSLHKLARKLNISIILTAGVSYRVDKRQNHHPKLSDLSIHGDIVGAANYVISLYSNDLYNLYTNNKSTLELKFLKGSRVNILLKNETKYYCRFKDYKPDWLFSSLDKIIH
jgi:replicative DNA helicase